jgi:DNA-binding Lrp family transcriptional regulator
MNNANNSYQMERSKSVRPFTIIDNEFIYKAKLAPDSKFLIIYLLGLPENWVMHTKHIQEKLGIGKRKLERIIKELTKAGYMERYQKKINGKIQGYVTKYSYFPEYKNDNKIKHLDNNVFNKGLDPIVPQVHFAGLENVPLVNTNSNKNKVILNNNPYLPLVDFDEIDFELSELEKELEYEKTELEAEIVSSLVRVVDSNASNLEIKGGTSGDLPANLSRQRVMQKSLVEEIFDAWKSKLNHPRAKLDDKRRKLIEKALQDYSDDDIITAFDGCSKTPHNMGDNDRGEVYDGLHIILRDAEQIERFMRNSTNPPKPRVVKTVADKMSERRDKMKKLSQKLTESMRNFEKTFENKDEVVYGQICGQDSGGIACSD